VKSCTYNSVAPVGVAMGLDIGLSNLSLVYVTVSFYTLAGWFPGKDLPNIDSALLTASFLREWRDK